MDRIVDPGTIILKLTRCMNRRSIKEAKKVHAQIIKTCLHSWITIQNQMITLYCRCRHYEDARHVFDKMPEPDAISWNSMLSASVHCGRRVTESFTIFRQILRNSIQLNRYNLTSILRACKKFQHQDLAQQLHTCAVKTGFHSNNFVGSTLLDFYAKMGRLEDASLVFNGIVEPDLVSCNAMLATLARNAKFTEARQLFDRMPAKDVTSFNSMIAGLTQNGLHEEALKAFCEAVSAGFRVDEYSFSGALVACAGLAGAGGLNQGVQIHGQCVKLGLDLSNVFVGSALVDMYAKCADIEDAVQVFEAMPTKNVVSWTALIVGCAQNGECEGALTLFQHMQRAGEKPNHVTFLGVLQACCNLGLVNQGLCYLSLMKNQCRIDPGVKHFCCIVGMLGRAGLLAQAHGILSHFNIEPNPVLWRTLLDAYTNNACHFGSRQPFSRQVSFSSEISLSQMYPLL